MEEPPTRWAGGSWGTVQGTLTPSYIRTSQRKVRNSVLHGPPNWTRTGRRGLGGSWHTPFVSQLYLSGSIQINCPRSPSTNGTEFAFHHQLHALGIETFFCDTHSPWQKGGVENAIGRLRRTLPRKTDLATLSDDRFTQLIQAYNNTPRKCLGYRTPAEIFLDQVLHLKCESTECPKRG